MSGQPELPSPVPQAAPQGLPDAARRATAQGPNGEAATGGTPSRYSMVRHLRWLVWLHYLLAVATAALGYQGWPYVEAGLEFLDGKRPPLPPLVERAMHWLPTLSEVHQRDPPLLGMTLVLCGAALMTLSLVHAGLLAYIGWLLHVRRRWSLCLIFSALDLMYFPAGTALGAYALFVLLRPEVRVAFGRRAADQPVAAQLVPPASSSSEPS
ncbi:MAG: hypothetical protein K6T86_17900 [Pirellulales bacterium]|nr:hypothetical protein [Pirellulales bacterium]